MDNLTEFEENVIQALDASASVSSTYMQDEVIYDKFLSLLREIMPPTCTTNERKFLDEIREKGEWASSHDAIWLDNGSEIFQSDFEVNLTELVDVT